jgi:hypothetical protein
MIRTMVPPEVSMPAPAKRPGTYRPGKRTLEDVT